MRNESDYFFVSVQIELLATVNFFTNNKYAIFLTISLWYIRQTRFAKTVRVSNRQDSPRGDESLRDTYISIRVPSKHRTSSNGNELSKVPSHAAKNQRYLALINPSLPT